MFFLQNIKGIVYGVGFCRWANFRLEFRSNWPPFSLILNLFDPSFSQYLRSDSIGSNFFVCVEPAYRKFDGISPPPLYALSKCMSKHILHDTRVFIVLSIYQYWLYLVYFVLICFIPDWLPFRSKYDINNESLKVTVQCMCIPVLYMSKPSVAASAGSLPFIPISYSQQNTTSFSSSLHIFSCLSNLLCTRLCFQSLHSSVWSVDFEYEKITNLRRWHIWDDKSEKIRNMR